MYILLHINNYKIIYINYLHKYNYILFLKNKKSHIFATN